jgi:hypothetical protein
MKIGLWRLNANSIHSQVSRNAETGSQVTSPGVPRSPNDVTREPKLQSLNYWSAKFYKGLGLDSQVTQFSVPRSLNDVTRESKLQKLY